MRLTILIGALALAAGLAPAVGAIAATASGEPVCTTTTTVVHRGDVVLSTTSTTHCETDKSQTRPAPAEPANGAPAVNAPPDRNAFEASQGFASKLLFGSGTPQALKPRDLLGFWSVLETGQADACELRLTREVIAGGYRVSTNGCHGALAHASAWKFEDTQAGLYDASGAPVAKLEGDRQHLIGMTAAGKALDLKR